MSRSSDADLGCGCFFWLLMVLFFVCLLQVGYDEVNKPKTPGGAYYWAVMQPDGNFKFYPCPRDVGEPDQLDPPGIVKETYHATGKFVIQDGKTAEIYELVKAEQ